jgi:hypothetical protein
MVVLNRFRFENNYRTKILTPVRLDFEMEIVTSTGKEQFELYAFILHIVQLMNVIRFRGHQPKLVITLFTHEIWRASVTIG